jgi:osmotically-inducible protein OsmY
MADRYSQRGYGEPEWQRHQFESEEDWQRRREESQQGQAQSGPYGSQGAFGSQAAYGSSQGQQRGYGRPSEQYGYANQGYQAGGYGSQGGYRSQQDQRLESDYATQRRFGGARSGSPSGFSGTGQQGGFGSPSGQSGSREHAFQGGSQGATGESYGWQGGWQSDFGGPSGLGRQPAVQRRGPKGYIRSDERIREDLCERLMQSGNLDVSEVEVNVKDGNVRLEGTVPERRMKHAIEDMAENCLGVKDVENQLRVSFAQQGSIGPSGEKTEPGASEKRTTQIGASDKK